MIKIDATVSDLFYNLAYTDIAEFQGCDQPENEEMNIKAFCSLLKVLDIPIWQEDINKIVDWRLQIYEHNANDKIMNQLGLSETFGYYEISPEDQDAIRERFNNYFYKYIK